MAGDKDTLLSMGFDPARVEWAMKATGGRGLQPAMDHILENEGKPVPELAGVSESASGSSNRMDVDEDDEDREALAHLGIAKAGDVEAKSIKCSLCGKIFKNTALANYHAEKSGHDQFEESTEEIKPLTEEEKKQKLEELRVKMAEKRARKALEEAKEHKDLGQIREDLKLKEAQKEAEARKREKIADAKAKAAIKAQIEADKKARAEKAAREKALREGKPIVDSTPGPSNPSPAAVAAATASGPRVHANTRLQIRMSTGGAPLITTLPSEAPLRELAEFVAAQAPDIVVDDVKFTQSFPRKTFGLSDFSKTLKDLGLVPSASLIANPY